LRRVTETPVLAHGFRLAGDERHFSEEARFADRTEPTKKPGARAGLFANEDGSQSRYVR
jgi:hypothetical protein